MTIKNKPIQSIKRAINIIDCFTSSITKLSLKDISEMTKINLNTARGIVNTLIQYGLLNYDNKEKLYSLGLYFSAKANLLKNDDEAFIRIAKPSVNRVSDKFSVTSSFQLVDSLQVCSIYSSSIHNKHYHIFIPQYDILPLSVSASGKLALAYNKTKSNMKYAFKDKGNYTNYSISTIEELEDELNRILEKGYSYEDQEYQIGVSGLSVPIFDDKKNIVATISITTFSEYLKNIKSEAIKTLKEEAKIIEENIKEIL